MRVRPLTLFTATAAVTLVVVAMCEAQVQAKVYSVPVYSAPVYVDPDLASSPPPPQLAQLLVRAITPPEAPETPPSTAFGGLQARVQRASDEAAAGGATLSTAILDRRTHQLVTNGNTAIVGTASVAKLFIADDLLLQESQGRTTLSPDDHQALDTMLQASDDGAAEKFWGQDGGAAIITQIAN